MEDLTGFQRDLLYVIAGLQAKAENKSRNGDGVGEGDLPHGLAIEAELDAYYTTTVTHGRLYPNLDTVVDKEFVEKGTKDRRTNSYELTDRGERELIDRREWEATYLDVDSDSDPERSTDA
jgi:PadR family transcriptional regulator PadR